MNIRNLPRFLWYDMVGLTMLFKSILMLYAIRNIADSLAQGYLWQVTSRHPISREDVQFSLSLVTATDYIGKGLALAVTILLLRWAYRANEKARKLGAQGLSFSPLWASWGLLVPFVNLWVAYKGMKELWSASKYGDVYEDEKPVFVWVWIAFSIAMFVRMLVSIEILAAFKNADKMTYLHALITSVWVRDAGLIAHLVATFVLVSKIHKAQREMK